jgi:branched-subunit amino acid transport protein
MDRRAVAAEVAVSIWWVIVLGGLMTFAIRLSFIAAEGRVALPDWFRAMLPYVPIATLTAIIVPEMAAPGGALGLSPHNPRLLAGAVAIGVALVTRSVLLTIAVGFAVLLVLVH